MILTFSCRSKGVLSKQCALELENFAFSGHSFSLEQVTQPVWLSVYSSVKLEETYFVSITGGDPIRKDLVQHSFWLQPHLTWGLPWWIRWYRVCLQCRKPGLVPWVGNIPQSRKWQPTPVLLPGKSHGWRSLIGCSPWGREEWDMTEQLHFHFSLLCIGEGTGNPLQCSCLENPRDRGAWWAAIYGGAQSWTWLTWLSSSSSSSSSSTRLGI